VSVCHPQVSCTNFVYPTNALFGAKAPERHIVVFGADKQRWVALTEQAAYEVGCLLCS